MSASDGGTYAYRCEGCPGDPPSPDTAQWQITRHGDVVVTWACDEHLSEVLRRLEHTRPDLKEYTVVRLRNASN
jgi:hypothetical protein